MKLFSKKYGVITFILLLSAVLFILSGCSGKQTPPDNETENEAAPSSDNADLSEYRIVRRDTADKAETHAAVELKKYMGGLGIELQLATDWFEGMEDNAETECEILVGVTNRAESSAFAEKVKSFAENADESENICAYGMIGKKILLYSTDSENMQLLAEHFSDEVEKAGKRNFLSDGDLFIFQKTTELCRKDGEKMKEQKRLFGVNIHSKIYPAYPEKYTSEYIRLAAEMGSTILRINYNPTDSDGLKYIKGVADECHASGMQIMLCMDDKSGTVDEISSRMKYTAENLADTIDYFQIFNETDVWCALKDDNTFYNSSNWTGMTKGYYNPERVKISIEKVGAAIKAFRDAAPEAKIVINVGSRHFPILDWYIEAGLSWDIIAFDIYEIDLWDHAAFFKKMEERYPGYDFMVAECNYPANNGPFTEEAQAKWLVDFFDIMDAYDSDRMKAVIIYELMDQPNIDKDGKYNGEAHFGIVSINEDYSPNAPKPSYYAVQKWILGGEAEFKTYLRDVK